MTPTVRAGCQPPPLAMTGLFPARVHRRPETSSGSTECSQTGSAEYCPTHQVRSSLAFYVLDPSDEPHDPCLAMIHSQSTTQPCCPQGDRSDHSYKVVQILKCVVSEGNPSFTCDITSPVYDSNQQIILYFRQDPYSLETRTCQTGRAQNTPRLSRNQISQPTP